MKRFLLSLLLVGCVGDKPAGDNALVAVKKFKCRNNLSQLWKMVQTPLMLGEKKSLPFSTGGEFWIETDTSFPELLRCPLSDNTGSVGTDYCGPSSNANMYLDSHPVGACIGNHPDGSGFVLQKSGKILEVREGDPLYAEALKKTKP